MFSQEIISTAPNDAKHHSLRRGAKNMEGPPKSKIESREERLQKVRKEVDAIVDARGTPVEEGIKEAVAVLIASGFRTSESCEGHPGEYGRHESPHVQMIPESVPEDNDEWWKDDLLRERVGKESMELQTKLIRLLVEFYQEREVPYDVMLRLSPGPAMNYGFVLDNNGGKTIESLQGTEKTKKYDEYKKEMDDFVAFLKEKYFSK